MFAKIKIANAPQKPIGFCGAFAIFIFANKPRSSFFLNGENQIISAPSSPDGYQRGEFHATLPPEGLNAASHPAGHAACGV